MVLGITTFRAATAVALTFFSSQPIYNEYNRFASTYDGLNGGTVASNFGIQSLREEAGHFATGNVLDVAVGTGLQNSFYDWTKIMSYTGIDMSQEMLNMAKVKFEVENSSDKEVSPTKATFSLMDAQSLDFPDRTFDTVVDTFSLCVIDDPQKAVSEMRRVLKDDGRIVLLENTLSNNPLVGFFQHATEPLVTPLAKGCRWDVNVHDIARASGLEPDPSVPSRTASLGTISLEVFKKSNR